MLNGETVSPSVNAKINFPAGQLSEADTYETAASSTASTVSLWRRLWFTYTSYYLYSYENTPRRQKNNLSHARRDGGDMDSDDIHGLERTTPSDLYIFE